MFQKLDILSSAADLARHAAFRQSVIAQNVANADTPGYRAKETYSFSEMVQTDQASHVRHSRPGHLLGDANGPLQTGLQTRIRQGETSPNGNSVAIETEMMAAAEAKRDHDLALTVYQTSLGIMRTALGRR